ncbi:hypothetical protein ACH3XW_32560 [Acanthocheilonema viteae]
MDTNFSFLNHIPGQKGYIVISTGCIVKSDGELENNELLAMNVQKMLSVGEPLVHVIGKIEKMIISYPEYSLEVVRSGKYIFIVKKKNN